MDIALGPVIVTFERGATQLTSDSRENVARFANAYRDLESAFSGVTLCEGKGEGTLPERRARYVEKRLVGAGAKPVMFGDPKYCDRLGGREEGQIILLILPPES
ncbi:hypothetical protein ATM17_01815 [Sphingopyxis macrogoltabida]|uniref:Uncharacterized protein n=1 Tax=Sphingopyxis macrogoltabida TaxID=33050 RepID=A0AAC9AUG3_SPHMC|nr:hypothetical protein ATM17_01815 [Sphingopyxis macrogoltabida]